MFCARLFICALWSPAGKGLTSWLSFVVSSESLSLSHWYPGSGVVLDCIDSWSLHHYLLVQHASLTVNIELSDFTKRYYSTVPSWHMKIRIDHWCSVVPDKFQPSGPPFSGKLGKPRFPLERLSFGLGFFCPHWTPIMDSIYLTHAILPRTSSKVIMWNCILAYSGTSGSLF